MLIYNTYHFFHNTSISIEFFFIRTVRVTKMFTIYIYRLSFLTSLLYQILQTLSLCQILEKKNNYYTQCKTIKRYTCVILFIFQFVLVRSFLLHFLVCIGPIILTTFFSLYWSDHSYYIFQFVLVRSFLLQHAQRVLARNHSGPTSVKSRKCR